MTTNNRHNETNEVLKKINDKNNLINEIDVLFY